MASHTISAILLVLYLISVSWADDGTTISTSEGPVHGVLLPSGVRQFLGIPYAADTSGSNRFMAPNPAPVRDTVFSATAFGDSCPQELSPSSLEFLTLAGLTGSPPKESENCLSVNIWAPAVDRPQQTSVMIWVYGGSFTFGTSNTVYYIGENFVRDNEDVTIVTLNYRTNIFSAPTAPQLQGGVGNFGILDVDAAITWVFSNIAGFGGDPNRIVLFGQSAGSGIVDAYAFSHPTDTIVKGLITQSGSVALAALVASGNASTPAANDPTSPWNIVAAAVGCGTAGDAPQFSCMQQVPFGNLESAVIANNLSFSAVIDGITLFDDFDSRSAAGQFLKVPLLVGNTANEGDIFVVAMEQLTLNFTIPIATQALADLLTEVEFNCPASQSASDRVNAGVPTFRYRYEGVFPDISSRPDLRAFHASEIPLVFGTYNSSSFPAAPTADEIALSRYMQSAWVSFATDPAGGLRGPGFNWPLYNPNVLTLTPTLAELGGTSNTSGVHFTFPLGFDAGCTVSTALLELILDVIAIVGIL